MITVTYVTNNGKFVSLLVKGHAQSAKNDEKDMVCAGVSAITIGGLSALDKEDDFKIDIHDGLVSVQCLDKISEHDEIVLHSVLRQLETIADSHPKFVTIKTQLKGSGHL